MIFKGILNTRRGVRKFSTYRRVVLNSPGPSSALVPQESPFDATAVPDGKNVRVKVAACAVAYRDIIDRNGGFPFMNKPTVLGHEVAGVVDAVGPESTFSIGDRVVSLHWAQFNGEAFPSPFEHKQGMQTFLGLTCDGGYAEYMNCHSTAFVKVPNPTSWSPIEAAPVISTFGTVWQGAVIRGGLKAGERVLVTGAAGGVGSSAVTLASKLGAHVIGATGNVSSKSQFIKSMGAEEVIDSSPGFGKTLGRSGVDMVIECVGAPTFSDSLRSLKPGGRLVLIGNVTNTTAPLPLGLCIVKSLSVIGTDSIESQHLETLFHYLDDHKIRPVIHSVLPLHRAAEAHNEVEKRDVRGRIVLDVNQNIW